MPLPAIAAAPGLAGGAVSLFRSVFGGGPKPSDAEVSDYTRESIRAAYDARDFRRLRIIADGGQTDLPYRNSDPRNKGGLPRWPVTQSWAGEGGAMPGYRAFALSLINAAAGTTAPPPSGGQIPNVQTMAAQTSNTGRGVGDAFTAAFQRAVAAGETELLTRAGLAATDAAGEAQRREQQASLVPFATPGQLMLMLGVAGVLFVVFKLGKR